MRGVGGHIAVGVRAHGSEAICLAETSYPEGS